MWPITKIILKIALVLLILMLVVALFLFRMAICRKNARSFQKKTKKKRSLPQSDAYREGAEALAASPYETYTIRSFDGLRLTGHFLPAASRNPEFILLCMHGYRSNGFKEYGIYKKILSRNASGRSVVPRPESSRRKRGQIHLLRRKGTLRRVILDRLYQPVCSRALRKKAADLSSPAFPWDAQPF